MPPSVLLPTVAWICRFRFRAVVRAESLKLTGGFRPLVVPWHSVKRVELMSSERWTKKFGHPLTLVLPERRVGVAPIYERYVDLIGNCIRQVIRHAPDATFVASEETAKYYDLPRDRLKVEG